MNEIVFHGDDQMITSLEIAKVVGKLHKNVMRDIKAIEPAWEKVHGLRFELMQMKVKTNNGGYRVIPCYRLSKLESLYVATKFNDEARAKLVLRWMELETRERERQRALMEAYESDAEYAHEVLQSHGTLTATQIAKELGMSARKLNRLLHDKGVIFKQSGEWQLYARYQDMGLMDKETILVHGTSRCSRREKWTERGHRFINDLIESEMQRANEKKPVYVQLTLSFAM